MRWAYAALWLCACGSHAPDRSLFRVSVIAQVASAQITRVSVEVAPAGVSMDLARDPGGTFSGTLGVPVGVQTATATAWAGLTAVGTASGAVSVVKGETAQLSITVLDATGAPPQPDHSPVIVSLTASASAAALGDQLSLSAVATDADGDPISFAWTAAPAGCGSFSAPASASTTFTAAAAGNCVVTVAAIARGLRDSRSATIAISGGGGPPVPALVQHLSSTSNPPLDTRVGNDFRFTLPNPVVAGNCLVLGISYTFSATRTVRIADGNGNVWPTSPAVTTSDGVNLISSIFVLPGARAGVTTLTVSFDSEVIAFQYTLSEFDNIDPVSLVNGTSSGQAKAPSLSTLSFTPGNNDAGGGNLVWSYFMDHEFVPSRGVSNFAAGPGFALLDADIGWRQIGLPHASQSFLQQTAAAVTPAMTTTGAPANEGFNGVAVALKVAPAGGAAPAGIRIGKIVHFTSPTPPTNWNFQFPTTGNLIVGVVCQKEIINITSVTDSKGNVYTKVAPFADVPQFWFAANATPDPDLHITVHSAGTPVNSSFLWYDISGADAVPLDGQAALTGGGIDVGSNSIADAPVITPQSLGLTLSAISFGTGPATGLDTGSPPLAIFDYVSYTGEIDSDRMDNADGRAHLYNTDLAAEHYNWILNHSMGTTASATAVHFKAAAP